MRISRKKNRNRLQSLLEVNAPLFTIHTMKEQLRDFWDKPSMEEAIPFLDAWCNDAASSNISQLKKVANTLMQYSHGLLNYYIHPISCGPDRRYQ
ncbi:MAG: transposase [Deltaproteobacteria bacterium]|nr:transposase [Deltaproteobacteria bacterium]